MLQAADDFPLRQTLGQPPLHVGQRRRVVAQSHDHDPVESRTGLPVAATIQPMADGLSAGGRDWAGTAELGEGRFRSDPLRIVPDQDRHLGCRARADAVGSLKGRRCSFGHPNRC